MSNFWEIIHIKKWIKERNGRASLVAKEIDSDVSFVHRLINDEFSASNELVGKLNKAINRIKEEESKCLTTFYHLRSFLERNPESIEAFSKILGVSKKQVLRIAKYKGEQRFYLMKYGVETVRRAMSNANNEYMYTQVNKDIEFTLRHMATRKSYKETELHALAEEVKKFANFGNHDVSFVLSHIDNDCYKVVGVGFDTHVDKMYKTHICDTSNPHIHATRLALMNIRSGLKVDGKDLFLFTNSAPCYKCAQQIEKLGIKRVMCLFPPKDNRGLEFLNSVNIPVVQYNYVSKSRVHLIKLVRHEVE